MSLPILQRAAFVAAGTALAIAGLQASGVSPAAAPIEHSVSDSRSSAHLNGVAADQDKFAVGVLRRDGIVVPFATFDGKRWRQDWPEPRGSEEIPASIDNVPPRWWGGLGPLDTWQAWTAAAAPLRLRVLQPDWYDAQCVRHVGLRTDYRSMLPRVDPKAAPFPKDGIAIAPPRGPETIERVEIENVGMSAPEVAAAFNEAERKAVKRFEDRSKFPIPAERRGDAQLKIEAIYAAGSRSGTRVYYVEASKQYAFRDRMNDDARLGRCAQVSFGGGWFVGDANRPLKPLGFEVAVVACNRYQARYMLPLGATRLAGRYFWIAQWAGWDYEEYSIVEIKQDKTDVALRAWGGGC